MKRQNVIFLTAIICIGIFGVGVYEINNVLSQIPQLETYSVNTKISGTSYTFEGVLAGGLAGQNKYAVFTSQTNPTATVQYSFGSNLALTLDNVSFIVVSFDFEKQTITLQRGSS